MPGNGLHRALQLGEGHREPAFALALHAQAKSRDHHGEHAAIGLGNAARRNTHADKAPGKPADHRECGYGRELADFTARFVPQNTCVGSLVPLLAQPEIPLGLPVLGEQASCSLDTIQQEMERLPEGTRRLAVQLRLALHPDWLWAVLTDYANLSRYIPNLASSRQLWRRGTTVGLEQVGTQQFCGLRFSAKVELELEEDRDALELRFAMRRGDFRRFEGTWRITSQPNGPGEAPITALFYELTVQGRAGMPIGLIEQRLRDDLASNLRGVQREALRRAHAHDGGAANPG